VNLLIALFGPWRKVPLGQVKTQVLEGTRSRQTGLRRLMGLRAHAYRLSSRRKSVLQDFSSRAPQFSSRGQPPDGRAEIDGCGLDPNSDVWKLLNFSQFVDAVVHLSLDWMDGVEWKRR
jgi:hypothetical protein